MQITRPCRGCPGACPVSVMISGYPSALYDRILEDWHSVSVRVMNQAGAVTEKIWLNFTDRQRIKRKAACWARRYRAMPPGERLAVLAAVTAVEAE